MRPELRPYATCSLAPGETRRVLNGLTASVCPQPAAVDEVPWPNTAPVQGTGDPVLPETVCEFPANP